MSNEPFTAMHDSFIRFLIKLLNNKRALYTSQIGNIIVCSNLVRQKLAYTFGYSLNEKR